MSLGAITSEHGFTRFPAIEGVDGRGAVEVYESSDAGHAWVHIAEPGEVADEPNEVAVQLTMESAALLRNQITQLINKHRSSSA